MSETTTEQKTWRVLDLINWTTDYLKEKGFPAPRSDVEWLLIHVLDCERVELYTDFEKPLQPGELSEFKALLKRRLSHEPVQYITGETEFMGYPFAVNESVLIPRPETEILVEHAVDWLRERESSGSRVLDIGTGSGCIAVSLGKLVPGIEVTALDNSLEALDVARSNAERNGVAEHIEFREQNILQTAPPDKYDLIISNPPYVANNEIEGLQEDIRKYEPENALVAGEEGLTFYQYFAKYAHQWITDGGRFMLEIGGTHQSEAIRELFANDGWSDISIIKDYNEQDRIVIAVPE
ncbi:MAG: peptide chain release factor N(5)-glutamine methyltransferase [Candidatus Marinimicrobia bacterium]|nr:peptide chain release factor N(5)-glutamine methyltransferase [Candidatus Neomarinimicrobiota bacterium]MCF7828842.1 peptide chain release factor N(5)-glutamine methyltransferase [Candidatus Neomarinimicrobiota bacterium]MCF7880759.1 peptide chain release factor N(5)-glutamine methyltransferase [Candidatus Neomarinimicrobiota bacterium]